MSLGSPASGGSDSTSRPPRPRRHFTLQGLAPCSHKSRACSPRARITAPHPQGLCPTCPAGVSGSEPAWPSGQLTYGKEACKQRTRGRWRTKVAGPFVCTLLSLRRLPSPPGAGPAHPGVAYRARGPPLTPHHSAFTSPHSLVHPSSLPGRISTPGEALWLSRWPGHSQRVTGAPGPEGGMWRLRGQGHFRICFLFQGEERRWRTQGPGRLKGLSHYHLGTCLPLRLQAHKAPAR